MFTGDILYIFFFIYYQVVYKRCFVSLRDRTFILFLLMTWPEYLFLKKTLPDPSQNQMVTPWEIHRQIQGGTDPPFCARLCRMVKTYFNRIPVFSVSSLSFFFLPCLVIFALNYVSVSFDISLKKMVSEIKRIPLMEMSGPASEIFVHCRTVWSVVNLWRRYNDLCCRLCKIFCFGE